MRVRRRFVANDSTRSIRQDAVWDRARMKRPFSATSDLRPLELSRKPYAKW
jgi:hypothetical protein